MPLSSQFAGMVTMINSMPMAQPEPKRFYVDHPFNFYILNKDTTTLFAGSIHKL